MLVSEKTKPSMSFEVAMNLEEVVELYRIREQLGKSLADALYDVIKRGMIELKAGWPEGENSDELE